MLDCTVSGKNMAHWEREIARVWEGLIDKAQPRGQDFFCPRDYPDKNESKVIAPQR